MPRGSQDRMAACEVLVIRYRDLVRTCVQRYRYGPEPAEDLMQVGDVGPVSAINGAPLLTEVLGGEDPRMEQILDMHAVATHWAELPPCERQVLLMRFYGNMTQDQIAARLGVSQMQVSRLLSRALAYLRPRLLGLV